MAKLRIEFTAIGAVRGRLGGQVNARAAEPLGSVTLDVTAIPTPSGSMPVVPAGVGTVFAELTAADAGIYVDIASAPDPTSEPRLLLMPGRPLLVHVGAGQAIAAMLAPDIPLAAASSASSFVDRSGTLTAGGAAQQACAARADRRFLLISNPDEGRTIWFSTTGAASAGAGSHAVLPGGAFVFDRIVPAGAVSVIGATTGQPFTVKEA